MVKIQLKLCVILVSVLCAIKTVHAAEVFPFKRLTQYPHDKEYYSSIFKRSLEHFHPNLHSLRSLFTDAPSSQGHRRDNIQSGKPRSSREDSAYYNRVYEPAKRGTDGYSYQYGVNFQPQHSGEYLYYNSLAHPPSGPNPFARYGAESVGLDILKHQPTKVDGKGVNFQNNVDSGQVGSKEHAFMSKIGHFLPRKKSSMPKTVYNERSARVRGAQYYRSYAPSNVERPPELSSALRFKHFHGGSNRKFNGSRSMPLSKINFLNDPERMRLLSEEKYANVYGPNDVHPSDYHINYLENQGFRQGMWHRDFDCAQRSLKGKKKVEACAPPQISQMMPLRPSLQAPPVMQPPQQLLMQPSNVELAPPDGYPMESQDPMNWNVKCMHHKCHEPRSHPNPYFGGGINISILIPGAHAASTEVLTLSSESSTQKGKKKKDKKKTVRQIVGQNYVNLRSIKKLLRRPGNQDLGEFHELFQVKKQNGATSVDNGKTSRDHKGRAKDANIQGLIKRSDSEVPITAHQDTNAELSDLRQKYTNMTSQLSGLKPVEKDTTAQKKTEETNVYYSTNPREDLWDSLNADLMEDYYEHYERSHQPLRKREVEDEGERPEGPGFFGLSPKKEAHASIISRLRNAHVSVSLGKIPEDSRPKVFDEVKEGSTSSASK